MKDAQFATISMRKETLLGFFEFLARSYEYGRRTESLQLPIYLTKALFLPREIRARELLCGGLKGKLNECCRECFHLTTLI